MHAREGGASYNSLEDNIFRNGVVGILLDMDWSSWLPHFDPQSLVATPAAIMWKVLMPPILYGFHGWIATWMAVGALFRPYNVHNVFGYEVQGIFPKRKHKLAQAVAATVTDTLLTPQDIADKVEEFLTEENIYFSIDVFFDAILKEFRDTTKLHRLASDIAELSPTLLQHLVDSIIEGLEKGKDRNVALVVEKIFEHMILPMRINLDQANELSARIMEALMTPPKIRNALIILLSPQNINALDESIHAHASGPYRILARIIGVKRVCYEWRNFLEKEPEEAHRIIGDLLKRFGIRDQIAVQIANFDLRSMPLQSIAKLKENVVSFVESFLMENRESILNAVGYAEGAAMSTVRSAIIRFNPESIPETWLTKAKADVASFIHAYLKRELGVLLEKAIPALGMYSLIANKIDLFSSEQMEALVKRICKQELKALEYAGGVIGFILGSIQIFINAFTF
ncbi:MAG TPA: DUF445 family protein [Candidatus Obscuribacterales bacterium]